MSGLILVNQHNLVRNQLCRFLLLDRHPAPHDDNGIVINR